MNEQKTYSKPLIILGLIILLLIPQASMVSLINDRMVWNTDALQKVEKSWPGEQVLAGPFLYLPYTSSSLENTTEVNKWNTETIQQGSLRLIPKQLDINAKLESHLITKGVHDIPVYSSHIQAKGFFDNNELKALIKANSQLKIKWNEATISYAITDQRGISSQPILSWQDQTLSVQPGSPFMGEASPGIHASIPATLIDADSPLNFDLAFSVKGMQTFQFAQAAKNISIDITSNWSSPEFYGDHLPTAQHKSKQGFTANWASSSYSNNALAALNRCVEGKCSELLSNTVGFSLKQPINNYRLAERSVKYTLVFTILSFTALLLFELFRKLTIHPIQYSLVGLELTVFYLLLISLSEHMNFGWAYTVATLASSGILTLYFIGVLKDSKSALIFGASLLSLYSILYVILNSEDHALLMGSLLMFGVLALFMLSTRRIDWYALTANRVSKPVTPVTEKESLKKS